MKLIWNISFNKDLRRYKSRQIYFTLLLYYLSTKDRFMWYFYIFFCCVFSPQKKIAVFFRVTGFVGGPTTLPCWFGPGPRLSSARILSGLLRLWRASILIVLLSCWVFSFLVFCVILNLFSLHCFFLHFPSSKQVPKILLHVGAFWPSEEAPLGRGVAIFPSRVGAGGGSRVWWAE